MGVSRVYLDSGGSAPPSRRTSEAVRAGLAEGWADPERLHAESRRSRQVLESSRSAIGEILGCHAEQLTFVPSLTVAFDRVIGGMHRARRGRDRIVVSAVERDALTHAARFAAGEENVTVIPVDAEGHLDLDALAAALDVPDVSLVCVQHANQEIGTVQDLAAVADICTVARVPLVVDATASIGHVPAPEHWDALIANPADWGAPAGIGLVALSPRARVLPAWPDGQGLDAGGAPVPFALASAVALQERAESLEDTARRLYGLVDRVRTEAAAIPGVDVVGDPLVRLPHVVTFSCLYADGEALVTRLDAAGYAVGSGSACTSDVLEPSRVLAAIGALTHGNVRIALHPGVTEAHVDGFLAALREVVDALRSEAGVSADLPAASPVADAAAGVAQEDVASHPAQVEARPSDASPSDDGEAPSITWPALG